MILNLDRQDLISLVKGTPPSYSVMSDPLIKMCGSYTGGFSDKWDWDDHSLNDLPDSDIYKIYLLCKHSWERKLPAEPETPEEALQKEFGPTHMESSESLRLSRPRIDPPQPSYKISLYDLAMEIDKVIMEAVRQNADPPIKGEITKEELEKRGIIRIYQPLTGRSYIAQIKDGKERRISDYF